MTNIAKITNLTRIKTYRNKKKKPRRTPIYPQYRKSNEDFFLLAENTHDKYRKNNKSNKNQDLEREEAKKAQKCPQI